MARRRDVPTRREATERADDNAKDLREREEALDKDTEDIETVRDTIEDLDLDGTKEGAEEVDSHMDAAQDIAGETFNEDDAELERVQQEGQEYEQELDERAEGSKADRERVDEGQRRLNAPDRLSEIERAKEAAARDIEFLKNLEGRVAKEREQVERTQESLRNRAGSARGSGR